MWKKRKNLLVKKKIKGFRGKTVSGNMRPTEEKRVWASGGGHKGEGGWQGNLQISKKFRKLPSVGNNGKKSSTNRYLRKGTRGGRAGGVRRDLGANPSYWSGDW